MKIALSLKLKIMGLVLTTSIILMAVSLALSIRQDSTMQEERNHAIRRADVIAQNGSLERQQKVLEKVAVNLLNTDELITFMSNRDDAAAKMVIEGLFLSFQEEGIVRFLLYDGNGTIVLEQAGKRPPRNRQLPQFLEAMYEKAAEDYNFYYYFRGVEGSKSSFPVEYCLVTVITDDDDKTIGFAEFSLAAERWMTCIEKLTGSKGTLYETENKVYTLATDQKLITKIGDIDIVGDGNAQFSLIKIGGSWLLTDIIPLKDPGENIVSYLLLSKDATDVVEKKRKGLLISIFVSCAIIVCALIIALLVTTRGIVGPIQKVIDFARNMAAGNFIDSLQIASRDEVGLMSEALNEMAEKIRLRAAEAEAISTGDLTAMISIASEEDVLGKSLQKIVDNLGNIIKLVRKDAQMLLESSSQVNTFAEEIRASSEIIKKRSASISEGSEGITEDVEKIASATEEMSVSVREISENTSRSKMVSAEANDLSQEANDTIRKLDNSADKIEKASGAISDFADQTNLLALNATIEAAERGQQAKVLQLLPREVKELAIQSISTAKSISQDVDEIQNYTRLVVKQTEDVASSISEIDETALVVSEALNGQAEVAGDLAETISGTYERVKTFANNVSDINDSISQNNDVIISLTSSAQEMSELADRLQKAVGQFTLN